jgi:hypothetical protein
MTTAPTTVYLHIGLHKTGTTYLQNVLRANREQIRGQQVEFTGGPGEPVQALAVWDLQGRRPRGTDDRRIAGMWNALVDHVNASGLPYALISEERLSLSTLKQARKVVDAFPQAEVHVIVTARDLGRVAVSAWQEAIKNDTTWTWQQFADAIKDPANEARNPARSFWLRQDLEKICEVWESVVPVERIHVVTVPPPGSPTELLLQRFTSVVGLDASLLTEEPTWNNETVGVAATEVLRQVNDRMGGRLNQRQYDRVIKHTLVPLMARRTEPVRFSLPADELGWVNERAERTIGILAARGYHVVGDLDELRTRVRDGSRRPDDATDDELLESSLDALALLAEAHATSWWLHRKPDTEIADAREGLASQARAVVFRGQRRIAAYADRSPLAGKAMAAVLRRRDRLRRRASRRARAASES